MPEYSYADLQRLAEMKNSGFQFDHQYRTNRYNLQKSGMSWEDADRLAYAYSDLTGEGGFTQDPLTMFSEVVSTLQKPVIAAAGAVASGRAFTNPLESLFEVHRAPLTTGRSFGEAGATGAGRLTLDVLADPGMALGIGAARMVGTGGRAVSTIGTAAREVAQSTILKKVVGEAGTSTRAVKTLEELLATPAKDLVYASGTKGAKSIQKATKEAYDVFKKEWRKENKGLRDEPPSIDSLFKPNAEGFVPASDLISMGASGLATFGIGSRRFVPLKKSQAAIARFLEKKGGKIPKRVFELDRTMRLAKGARSSRVSREAALTGKLAAEDVQHFIRQAADDAGLDDVMDLATREQYQHVYESVGRLQEGGIGAEGKASRAMDDSPEKSARVLNRLLMVVDESINPKARKAALKKTGFFEKHGAKNEGLRELLELPSGYDPAPAKALKRKLSALVDARRAARESGDALPDWDDFVQRRHVQEQIKDMALHIFGVKKDSKEWRFMENLSDMFMKMGKASVDAGVLSRVYLGYLPREATPGFKALTDTLNESGVIPGWKAGVGAASTQTHLDPMASFVKKRLWDNYTMSEIEDMFRRGEVASLRGKTPDTLSESFKAQVGINGWNRYWPRFTSLFGKKEFLEATAKADPELARVFFSDPVVFATMNRAKWARVLNARDYIRDGLDNFATNVITREKGENVGVFHARVKSEIGSRLEGQDMKWRVVYRLDDAADPTITERMAKESGGDYIPGVLTSDQIGSEALSKLDEGELRALRAYILPKDISGAMFEYYRRVLNPASLQGFGKHLQAFTRFWKAWALAPRPAYHFRNFISNHLQQMAAGMSPAEMLIYDVRVAELTNAMKGSRKTFDTLTSPRARGLVTGIEKGEKAFKAGRNLDDVFLKGTLLGDLTGEEVLIHAWNEGVLNTGFFPAEIAREVFERSTKDPKLFRNLSDNVLINKGHQFGESLENLSRLGTFMWGLKKGMAPVEAADLVRTFFFNYGDLRPGEKLLRSTAIPFWSWARNNVPLQIRQLIRDPFKTALPFKIAHSARAQWDISKDIEPEWISNELGMPMRVVKGPDGRDLHEYQFSGSFLPVVDLLRIGSSAMAITKQAFVSMGLLPKEIQATIANRRDVEVGLRNLSSHLNPAINQMVEKLTGFSLMRLSKLKPERGGMVYVPFMNMYTTPERASLIAMFPLLGELNRLSKSEGRFGEQISMRDRITRVLTGTDAPYGAKYVTDLKENAQFAAGRAQGTMSAMMGSARRRDSRGEFTPEMMDDLLERLEIHGRKRLGINLPSGQRR